MPLMNAWTDAIVYGACVNIFGKQTPRRPSSSKIFRPARWSARTMSISTNTTFGRLRAFCLALLLQPSEHELRSRPGQNDSEKQRASPPPLDQEIRDLAAACRTRAGARRVRAWRALRCR